MSKFNIGDKVVSKRYPYLGEELGVIVGIDTRENAFGKYLVKFDSLEISEGWAYGCFSNNPNYIVELYEGYATWLNNLIKVEDECKENECEEDIRTKFESVRKQKEEIVKEMGEKVLELTLEIKEIEHEIEKIKKEWHLD